MSNGNTINSIKKILTGDEPIPEKVSNELILAAITENHQNISCFQDEMKALQDQQTKHDIEINELKKRSDRWDVLNTVAVGIASAFGFYFGQK